MSDKEIIGAGSAFQTLVHQFSDPLSFYRELVQNALDAGSRYVDISMSYTSDGQTEIVVEDSGQGMTAEIIESQLTCLFSSQKDDDLTLIGKFGIGFVSVFALNPELVTVETARDGEAWRIDFFQDGSFERRPLDTIREGTKIRLLKTNKASDFEDLKKRSHETLLYWCKHVQGEISFCGEQLVRPFGIDVECPLVWSEPDTEIQIGYDKDFRSFIGFYNQGLTLLESNTEHTFQSLVVKINSKFLEHTLTRDKIVEDEQFARLMTKVTDLIERELPEKLFAELENTEDKRDSLFAALGVHFAARPLRVLTVSDLLHKRGEAYGDDWIAWPERHIAGRMCDGPTLPYLGPVKALDAIFRLSLAPDTYTEEDRKVAKIGVVNTADLTKYIVHKELFVSDFKSEGGWTNFPLKVPYGEEMQLDFLVYWEGEVPLIFRDVTLQEPLSTERKMSETEWQTPALRSSSGKKLSAAKILRAHEDKKLFLAPVRSALSEAAENSGLTTLLVQAESAELSFLEHLINEEPLWLAQNYVFPLVSEETVLPALQQSLKSLCLGFQIQLREVRLGRSCCQQNWSALLVSEIGQLERLQESLSIKKSNSIKTVKRILVLNSDSTDIQRLLKLADTQSALAAFLLVKHILLQTGASVEMDSTLAIRAWRELQA